MSSYYSVNRKVSGVFKINTIYALKIIAQSFYFELIFLLEGEITPEVIMIVELAY